MFKKFFLLLFVAMLNVVAWADPEIQISSYAQDQMVGETKFKEPTVAVMDGTTLVSNQYNFSYSIVGGTDDTDSRGVPVSKDGSTGTTVEKTGGNVIVGKTEGTVTIRITATPKAGSGTLTKDYSINVQALTANLAFMPNFAGTSEEGYDGEIVMTTIQNGWWYVKSEALLPAYRITNTTVGGIVKDVTDCYDVTVTFDGGTNPLLSMNAAKDRIIFNQGTSLSGSKQGTLTYHFVAKPEYAGYYSAIADKKILIKLELSSGKKNLSFSLTRDDFNQENVSGEVYDSDVEGSGYIIHVYKYGTSDVKSNDAYQYKVPTPKLISDGASLPMASSWGKGSWGDFKLIYKIVEDNTYEDDCNYIPPTGGTIQPAGEPTGLSIDDHHIQVAKPGLIKVAVYAVLDGTYDDNGYGANLKAMYNPYIPDGETEPMVIPGQWGSQSTVYAKPQYFYIDVMKRQPNIKITPDPSKLNFLKGDKIRMTDEARFEVSGYIDDSSNGLAETLVWGNDLNAFRYQFFISTRNTNGHIRINDWWYDSEWETKGGDDHSYPTTYTVMNYDSSVKDRYEIGEGDIILVKKGENLYGGTTATEDTEVEITAENVAFYRNPAEGNHQYLVPMQDKEPGIMYNSMKDWGNESWTMEFLETGTYNIPYVIRPWNHVKWDVSAPQEITFRVLDTTPTFIELSYYFQTANKGAGDTFTEPEAKVRTVASHYDVTGLYAFTYSIDADPNGTGTTIDAGTGNVTIGDAATGDVRIKVEATRTSSDTRYENPAPTYYTIRIKDPAGEATWEIISTSKSSPCEEHATHPKFDFDIPEQLAQANGRMHFLTVGNIYGGTTIQGVPGINLTIGTSDADAADWKTEESTSVTDECCAHETESVIVTSTTSVVRDEDDIPTSGAFYAFTPTVNGYLTVDGNFQLNHTILLISRNSKGVIEKEEFRPTTAVVGDHAFEKALVVGQTYYLYDLTSGGAFRLHGFRYQPAFVYDRNTTLAESKAPIEATTFMNSLSSGVPTLHKGSNPQVAYTVHDYQPAGVIPAEYLTVGTNTGALTPVAMTIKDGSVFKLRVKATVSSIDASLGTDVNKETYYHIQVLDIPKYIVPKYADNEKPLPGLVGEKHTTENIKTAITMTYGGFVDDNNKYSDNDKTDGYEYKGPNQVKAPTDSDDATYSKVIDTDFVYFVKGTQNPVDENNYGALQQVMVKDPDDEDNKIVNPLGNNNGSYMYASGTSYEKDEETYYNTTYRVPARGAYLKFEPRESGVVLLYLCQDGACDYYDGKDISSTSDKSYQAKWRPLYITDETGKPAKMVNSFGNIGQFMDTGEDAENAGSFTLGLSRCNPDDPDIAAKWNTADGKKVSGSTFDWSEFRGTEDDIYRVLAKWPNKGERLSIVRLSNGGFSLADKAYVRYSFEVKAGKTYFVFQPGSKPMFGGFAFVPEGFPDKCKYVANASGDLNPQNQEKTWSGNPGTDENVAADLTFTWDTSATRFTGDMENINVTINDRRNSELTNEIYTDRNEMKPRTFTAGNWESLCLPFSVSESEMTRVFGANYVLVTFDGIDDEGRLHFIRHANGYVEAGRPYLIQPTAPGTFSFKNVTIEGGQLAMEGNTIKVTDHSRFDVPVTVGGANYVFKGTYMRETVPGGSYLIEGTTLQKYNTTKIGGYRAYLQNVAGNTSNPGLMSFSISDLSLNEYIPSGDEEITGVISISPEGEIKVLPDNAGIYSMSGVRVGESALDLNSAPSGVYIVNGKKYVK